MAGCSQSLLYRMGTIPGTYSAEEVVILYRYAFREPGAGVWYVARLLFLSREQRTGQWFFYRHGANTSFRSVADGAPAEAAYVRRVH